jgi:protein translocase SecG subunit
MWDAIWSARTLFYILLVIYLPACFGLIAVVLFQQGKGSGFAGAFGVGPSSDAVFGPRATKNLLQRLTGIMAGIFMLLAVVMSVVANQVGLGVAPELEPQAVMTEAGETSALPLGSQGEPEIAPEIAPDLFEPAPADEAGTAEEAVSLEAAPTEAPELGLTETAPAQAEEVAPESAEAQ